MKNLDYQIGIVGAGFGGIIAGINLLKSGRQSFIIFEKANELGGVWRENIYPGCACDIKSVLYSIKSEPKTDWSNSYPKQEEILQYLKDVVAKYKLECFIRYNTEIVELKFEKEKGYWLVKNKYGRYLKIRIMILATGPHRLPYKPDIPGHTSFKGKSFHSAEWDSTINLSGRTVAVIGTGASCVQIVPNIAKNVSKLYVFQRSAAWILPRGNRRISFFSKWLHKSFPFTQRLKREVNYWFLELIALSFLGNKSLHKILTRIALRKLKREITDPQTRTKLTPTYSLGCKRILLSDDFYPAFNRSNVILITNPINKIGENKIFTDKGQELSVDILIYATGFTVADVEKYISIIGLDERDLCEEWNKTGAEAYKGISVAGYPNLCFLLGPNSGLSHSSVLHIIESQMTYVLQYILEIERNSEHSYLDVKTESQWKYNQSLQKKLKKTTFSEVTGCISIVIQF